MLNKFILFCFFILLPFQSLFSKENFIDIIKEVDWNCTEAEFVYKFHSIVDPINKEVWSRENSESNFCFKNIYIGEIPISNKTKSYIRVNSQNKKIFRLNFIFLYGESDKNKYLYIENILKAELGEPTETHIVKDSKTQIWIYDYYKIETLYMNITPEYYIYTIKAEPL